MEQREVSNDAKIIKLLWKFRSQLLKNVNFEWSGKMGKRKDVIKNKTR